MAAKKRVLIITDGTDSIRRIAESIEKALIDCEVKICPASDFAGNDILPAEAFFLGCESPNPGSFAYLEEMLEHINLAPRSCGIFSNNKDSLKYMSGLLSDCEASLGEPLLASDGSAPNVENWLKATIK